MRIGDTSIVYWTDKADPAETMLASLFDLAPASAPPQDQAQLDRLKGILKNLRKGCPLNEADKELNSGARFFILGLAPNAARLSVRFWLTDTLEALLQIPGRQSCGLLFLLYLSLPLFWAVYKME